jgi:phenylacetate-coenzyme A ligase PaaK-like adenylate-forming protein
VSEAPLAVPDARALAAVQRLCEIADPYACGPAVDALFALAMNEITRWHGERSPFYGNLLGSRGFKPEDVRSVDDCARVPFVLANFFKTHEVLSIPRDRIVGHFTSSGTTGQKSQMFFDRWSLGAGQRMLDRVAERNGWLEPAVPTNYLLYSYETEPDSKLGTAYTDHYLCKYAPAHDVFHALRRDGRGGHEFDVFGAIERLERWDKEGRRVRIFGYPAFLHFTLQRMRDLGRPPLQLSDKSLVFLGGGWKGHADRAIPKAELYAETTRRLGIPSERLRDGFGSVEHPIPYVECASHRFHVPVWSRVYIRDARTLEPVGWGRPGLLHFVSPYITSAPAHSVLMGDLATLFPGSGCPCGIKTPFFVVHGRAGTGRNKSCAIAAAELLAR